MYRILVSPLSGDRPYWLPASDIPAVYLTPEQVDMHSHAVTFSTEYEAAVVVSYIRALIGGRLDIIYKSPRRRA